MDLPICFYCSHRFPGQLKCKAFKKTLIPDEILFGKDDHSTPLSIQGNKVIFKPKRTFKDFALNEEEEE